jgi:hypothetical protein
VTGTVMTTPAVAAVLAETLLGAVQ